MRRAELEHIIRAAADIADDEEIVVIGSQAVLGQFPDAPEELCVSNEADVYPKNRPDRWDVIDGSIGELSPFHDTYGYTRGATGLCLEIHDLVSSKYLAHREKDLRFNRAAIRHGLVDRATLEARLATTEVDEARRTRAEQSLLADFRAFASGRSD